MINNFLVTYKDKQLLNFRTTVKFPRVEFDRPTTNELRKFNYRHTSCVVVIIILVSSNSNIESFKKNIRNTWYILCSIAFRGGAPLCGDCTTPPRIVQRSATDALCSAEAEKWRTKHFSSCSFSGRFFL